MSEYSRRAAQRDEAWGRFTDYLDALWKGREGERLDPDKFLELRDAYENAVKRVDELWKEGTTEAFKSD